MKPVRLPAAATNALPRMALLALALLYILPGLIGRDPWKNEDATSFGIMWTMAHGNLADWLTPNVAGLPLPAESPLAYWFGAICIQLFGWLLGDPLAARVSTIGCFLVGSLSIWYTTYLLGRRPEAQPLKLAFGGQPEPKDFGRTLADGAFLIYLGFLGLLLHSHETSPKTLQIALVAYAMYGAARVFDAHRVRHALGLGLALGMLVLTYGWLLPVGVLLALVLLTALRKDGRAAALVLGLALPLALLICAAWLLALHTLIPSEAAGQFELWMSWNTYQLNVPTLATLAFLGKYGVWFAWPAWPFAGWALYAWRRQLGSLHIALPLAFLIPITLLVLMNIHREEGMLLPLLPALAILAAFGLPTMKRGAINAVDWFSVMTLTTSAAFIWIGWIAKETGWPAQIARNAYKLAPGFKPGFAWISLAIAIAATIAWIVVVHWRISRRPSVLWRAVVLSSGGVILCWVLLMTLWLPWVNYGKSYAGVAEQIESKLGSVKQCVQTNVGPAQRASFAYFGNVRFADEHGQRCDYLLLQDDISNQDAALMLRQYPGAWRMVWEGRRPSDRDERFRLYRRSKD
ncbi:glycosyltransferase [Herbaspirillum seropedicae]|uniref:Undecaprenyl-phosphate-4-amino-L-arabinose--lipid A 4-amino-L-arabinosyltransferase protein n=1 Tax=Herbaspirillum seropedicae (strain SmR1) TaxID=757424 RepID=D8J038_HERSS|nr:glycosyl transferase [Herbaspirillum seropedicae]ADJ62375.1 undecaprenyl-phosphate-4-amino-L-arabinose--lipid A 4-amino-L-arabinosyltransferase protein [Herbaspirillum seropedicae SmR1]AKN68094.1 glycosyltransferase [Herbaspirillum seropedicae]AON53102.1 undecaprenyl-phosphate-4-amino-L-arabinose--lipid A 4-amino-L-arabinosyltransferase [Herbaspirillum seropedicae]NQE31103.1 glycosyltransferase [Herbaspirillum seropedicae]UMU20445.1 glycosyltransferase [Herbaspirillum seropedicae]